MNATDVLLNISLFKKMSELKSKSKSKSKSNLIVAVDASRCKSGGARGHLIGILSNLEPCNFGISIVHVWTYKSLLNQLPEAPWLIKHCVDDVGNNIFRQLWWQAMGLYKELKVANCDILFSADSSTLCQFLPIVVLNQDLLAFEPGLQSMYGYTRARIRLFAIRIVQSLAFRRSNGVIFLTQYASKVIQKSSGAIQRSICIPHGVDPNFKEQLSAKPWPAGESPTLQCIYVSNAELYKNQWHVIEAISHLRDKGYKLNLLLVGGGHGTAKNLINKAILRFDPNGSFVTCIDFVSSEQVKNYLANSDIFIFASGCETFGITLLEGMSMGLPIACSNRSSLPETLGNAGVYFNPVDAYSISGAVEKIINSEDLRKEISNLAKTRSNQYTWSKCANETWAFITESIENPK